MKTKNICMISQSPYPFDPRVRRQAEKLASAGFQVDIFCLPSENDLRIQKFGKKITAYRILKKNAGQESIKKYIWQSLKFFISAFIFLQRLSRKKNYSMIQIHNMPEFHVFSTIMQKLKGVPVVLDMHDLTPELLTSKWENNSGKFLKPITIFIEKISCRYSDFIITVTEGCKEKLAKRSAPPEKITLVLNTANTAIFPFYSDRVFQPIDHELRLLYHGTVAERFGLHIVVKAIPQILKKIPGTVLEVYGKYDADYRIVLEKLIKDLNLEQNVVLGEARTHEELYDVMKEAHIEVVPYVSNEYMNLSLSTKAFECAAAGLPVVATDLRTMRTAFNNNSIMYAKDNERDFADKIIHLACHPELRESMSHNAYEALKEISGDIMEERYLSLVERITGMERTSEINMIETELHKPAEVK